MSRFEDRVWSEMVSAHGARLAALPRHRDRRRRVWPVRTGAAVGLAAVAITVGAAIDGGPSSPAAYAVTDNRDGTVTLTIRQLRDRAAVNRTLARLGVRARVVPLRQDCHVALRMPWRYLQPSTQPWSEFFATRGPIGSWTVVLIPGRIPAGHTLVFAPSQTASGWEMADAIVAGPGPSCSSPEFLWGLSRGPNDLQQSMPLPNGTTIATTSSNTPGTTTSGKRLSASASRLRGWSAR